MNLQFITVYICIVFIHMCGNYWVIPGKALPTRSTNHNSIEEPVLCVQHEMSYEGFQKSFHRILLQTLKQFLDQLLKFYELIHDQKSDGGVRTRSLKTHPPTHIFSGIYQYLQIFDKYLLTFQVFRKFLYDIKKNRFKSRDSRW